MSPLRIAHVADGRIRIGKADKTGQEWLGATYDVTTQVLLAVVAKASAAPAVVNIGGQRFEISVRVMAEKA